MLLKFFVLWSLTPMVYASTNVTDVHPWQCSQVSVTYGSGLVLCISATVLLLIKLSCKARSARLSWKWIVGGVVLGTALLAIGLGLYATCVSEWKPSSWYVASAVFVSGGTLGLCLGAVFYFRYRRWRNGTTERLTESEAGTGDYHPILFRSSVPIPTM